MRKTESRFLPALRRRRQWLAVLWFGTAIAMPWQWSLPILNYAGDADGDGYDDATGDYLGDPYSLDDDDDGISNGEEIFGFEILVLEFVPDEFGADQHEGQSGYWTQNPEWVVTDPNNPDTDGDLWPDGFEYLAGYHPLDPADGNADDDVDLLTNGEEYQLGTIDTNPDTDGGGSLDGEEVLVLFTDPLHGADDGAPAENPDDPEAGGGGSGGGGGPGGGGGGGDDGGDGSGNHGGDGGGGSDGDDGSNGGDPTTTTGNPPAEDDIFPIISLTGRTSRVAGGEPEGGDDSGGPGGSSEVQHHSATGDPNRDTYDHYLADGWESVSFTERDDPDTPLEYDEFGNVIAFARVYDWEVKKTFTIPGGEEGGGSDGTDYVAFNEKYGSTPLVLVSASELDFESGYSGDITANLAFVPLTDEERLGRDNPATTTASVTGGPYPTGNWSEIWLRSNQPVGKEIRRSFAVVSRTQTTDGSADPPPKFGTVTLIIEPGDRISTRSESSGDLGGSLIVHSGIIIMMPPVPVTTTEIESAGIFEIDLDVDSNNDGDITEAEDVIEEFKPGVLVSIDLEGDDTDWEPSNTTVPEHAAVAKLRLKQELIDLARDAGGAIELELKTQSSRITLWENYNPAATPAFSGRIGYSKTYDFQGGGGLPPETFYIDAAVGEPLEYHSEKVIATLRKTGGASAVELGSDTVIVRPINPIAWSPKSDTAGVWAPNSYPFREERLPPPKVTNGGLSKKPIDNFKTEIAKQGWLEEK